MDSFGRFDATSQVTTTFQTKITNNFFNKFSSIWQRKEPKKCKGTLEKCSLFGSFYFANWLILISIFGSLIAFSCLFTLQTLYRFILEVKSYLMHLFPVKIISFLQFRFFLHIQLFTGIIPGVFRFLLVSVFPLF